MIAANAIRTKIKIIPKNTNASLNFVQGADCSLFDDDECSHEDLTVKLKPLRLIVLS